MKAVVMAGGEGTRLRPLTSNQPKPMVPVAGKPCMEHIIELLRRHGMTDIVVTVAYLPQVIRGYFDDGGELGVELHYSVEETPLGTAGSVKNAAELLDETFLVISGDALCDFDLDALVDAHRRHGAVATLALYSVENPLEFGVVITDSDGRVERFLEKPSWGQVFSDTINTGVYVLEPEVLAAVPEGTSYDFSKQLFPDLLRRGKPVYGHLVEGYWQDIGNLDQYRKANFDALDGHVQLEVAGIRLRESGRKDFLIFEREARVGGTWYRNTDPGAACDIASHLYCFSFAPNPDWTRPYAPQPEIQRYLERVAREHRLDEHLRLGSGVVTGHWGEERARWQLVLDSGAEVEAQFVISAVEMFGEIAVPDIPGLETFRGHRFHSAQWDRGHDLAGERVAVIGSAASAVQFVPESAKQVSQLHVFQRTANWVLPKDDTPYSREQMEAFRSHPELMAERRQKLFEQVEIALTYTQSEPFRRAEEVGRTALQVVEDPVVRERLTPDHPFGCKRPLFSNDYLQTFNRSNVELVVDQVLRLRARRGRGRVAGAGSLPGR